MGGICPVSTVAPPQPNKEIAKVAEFGLKSTQRSINQPPKANLSQRQPQYPPIQRKPSLNTSVQSTGTVKQKTYKLANTTTSSSLLQGKNSMSSQLSIHAFNIESSSIIRKFSNLKSQKLPVDIENCYVLIDNLFLSRKSKDSVKVISPHSQSRLNCPINNVISTFYVSEGLPLGSFKEIGQLKIIQSSESPILVKMRILCKNCQKIKKRQKPAAKARQVKMTFANSLIQSNQIVCDECGKRDSLKLISIESNFPVWGNGNKIAKGQSMESLPSTIRVMGCIGCFLYPAEYQTLPCGCIKCFNCYEQSQSKQCKLCSQEEQNG